MSTLSTSLYGASTNKGVGGLLSGLDTEDLVKQMTAATRNKINRQYQSKQKLLYRQEAYREISTKLLTFSDKYLSYSTGSKTNVLSPSFFKAYTYKSSSDYVNVSGNAENIKNFSINSISEVASAATTTATLRNEISDGTFSTGDMKQYISLLAGDTMSIEYSGKAYNLTLSSTFGVGDTLVSINDVKAELNAQINKIADLNGKISYDVISGDKLEIISSEGKEIKLVAASHDIEDYLKFSIADGSASSINPITDINSLSRTAVDVFKDSSITFDFNGTKKTINLNDTINDATTLETYLKNELVKAYGTGKVDVKIIGDKLSFSAVNVGTDVFGVSSISTELGNFIGIKAGYSNRLNTTSPINTIKGLEGLVDHKIDVNGTLIDVDVTKSINDIIKKINNESDVNVSYSSTTGKFIINSKETGASSNVSISGALIDSLFGSSINVANGQDTKMNVKINGEDMDITRSSANFAIDGINIELNKNAVGASPITFDVTNNSEEVVERFKQFINDYNDIITLIGTKTKEKPNRNYLPLTPEQQDDMEKDEIENWTKEAKMGVLFSDNNMTTVLRELRTGMTGKTSVSDLVLSNIGISAASMDTSGKLVFDEKKFKEKLLENPDEIASLFTGITAETGDAKSGIAVQIQDIIRENIGVFGTSGKLIEEAGLDIGRTSDQNNITQKMKKYDDKMTQLKRDLEVERKRYWNQFSSLESSLNKLNAQSSWLTDMAGK